MRETIGAVVRKPVFRIKLIAISLLFVVSLIEQVSNNYIQSSGQQVGRMTVILLLMHTFSYFSFYLSVFFVGYILLIPDIVKDAFIERQTMMRCQSRMRAAKYAIGKIIAFSILYVIWFVMLTILVGGIWFHDFSLAWPKFMDIQQRQLAANGLSTITWINIPVGAGKYPTLLVAGLICLRSTIGFIFLGLLALLVTLITGKTRNGMGIVILLAAIAGYVKLYMNDVGLFTNILYSYNVNAILKDEVKVNLGAVYETVVTQELKAHGHNLYYYDRRKVGEVDYLIDDYSTLSVVPIEIKSGRDGYEFSALKKVIALQENRIQKGYVFSNDRVVKEENNIVYMPIYYIMFM